MPETQIILLAEDREDDVLLIRQAFKRAGVTTPVHVVREGEEAIEYLAGKGKYASRAEYPLPGLLLLDLKMPRCTGFDVLRWVRRQPTLSSLLVIVLTSSHDMQDVRYAYELGANSFLVKPMNFENTVALAEMINNYWLHWNKIPDTERPPVNQPNKQKTP